MSPLVYFLIIFVCIIVSAFFSGSETALLRLTEDQIDRDLKKKPNPGMLAAQVLIKSSSKLLVTILMGNNVVNILAASCASAVAVYYLGDEVGLLVSTVAMTAIVLIFAEVLPKAVAASNPRLVSYRVALPLYLIHKLATPFHILFDKCIDPLVRKIAGKGEDDILDAENILRMARNIDTHKSDGTPMPIIWSAVQAANLTAEHIMTPNSKIFACSIKESPKNILDKVIERRFTRVPIFEGDINKIIGTIHLKDLIRQINDESLEIEDIIKPVLRVPERKSILELLAELQEKSIHMAIVKDEHGSTRGVVTLEDVLEELVGEIRDEFDSIELNSIKKVSTNVYDVVGTILVQDFNKETGWDLNAALGDTLAGLIFNTLGRIAKQNDKIKLTGYSLKVAKFRNNKIQVVTVTREDTKESLR